MNLRATEYLTAAEDSTNVGADAQRGLVMAKQISQRRILPWWIGVGAILAASCTSASLGQILVDLTIDGPSTVAENSETQYSATAHFDDGSEFDVTIFCDWLVKPDTYASIDTFGRLTTLEVSEDQAIVLSASFTWRNVTLDASIDVTIIDVTKDPEGDPWPEWQRNASRLGRGNAIGPQTPSIAWSVRVDPSKVDGQQGATPVLDAQGRIFAAHHVGVAAVDSKTHEILWQFASDYASSGVSLWNGRLLFGTPDDVFYCVDADTGEEIWSVPAEPHPNRGSVVDANGVVYYPSQLNVLYARPAVDPSKVDGQQGATPVLDAQGRIFAAHHVGVAAVDSKTHEILWQFASDYASSGVSLWNGRLLFGTPDDVFYCVDADTGEEIWSVPAEPHPNRGSVVDANGVVYYPSQLNVLYARRVADGSEVWTHNHPAAFNSAPALDGLGQLYIGNIDLGQWLAFDTFNADIVWTFLSFHTPGTSPVENGRVYVASPGPRRLFCIDAVTGKEIWQFDTEFVTGGVAIGNDGTLYVNASGGSGWLFAVSPDGEEIWRYPITNQSLNHAHPTVLNADIVWTFLSFHTPGTSPVENGRVYVASPGPRRLFCIDAVTGKEIWQFDTEFVTGGVAIGNDGTLYVNASGGSGWLFAVSPDGEEIWRYPITNQSLNHAPIVDAVGNVYFCTYFANEFGWLHAVGADGKGLWVKEMPNQVSGSPMLAPDGTLYVVCRDKYLYAFKDPDVLGDLDGSGSVGAADLLALLASWGSCPDLPETCPADLDLDNIVGASDLLILLANWG